jgi:periplasmic protein TonB
MAYLDQRRLTRSPATLITVAALEAAAIYGVVRGLAVTMFPPKPPTHLPAVFTGLPEPKPLPTAKPSHADPVLQVPQPQPSASFAFTHPKTGPSAAPTGEPTTFASPSPSPTGELLVQPSPSPTSSYAPRYARPKGSPGLWVSTSDYPSRDLNEGNQGLVRFSLSVSADGKVQGCAITGSSGFPGLDKAACTLITRRARFEPATDATGAKVFGNYSGSVRWVIPE